MNRIAAAKADIRALGVERLALFDSVLRGSPTPESNIDFVVKFRDGAKSYDRFNALCDLLENILGRRVELVTTEALSPCLGPVSWLTSATSFEPRDYLLHILADVDYLLDRSQRPKFDDLSGGPNASARLRS